MKVTVELESDEITELCALTGESKKGPAVRKVVVDALMMKKRLEIGQKFLTGEWSAELEGYEESQRREKLDAAQLRTLWDD
jgi:hypothetical protein